MTKTELGRVVQENTPYDQSFPRKFRPVTWYEQMGVAAVKFFLMLSVIHARQDYHLAQKIIDKYNHRLQEQGINHYTTKALAPTIEILIKSETLANLNRNIVSRLKH